MKLKFLSEETDRHGNRRIYARRNGRRIRISAEPGTTHFAKAYSDALEALDKSKPETATRVAGAPKGTLGWLATRYFASAEFLALAPDSQRTRRLIIEDCLREDFATKLGPKPARLCPIDQLTPRKIKHLRDLKAKPGAANNRRKYLSALFGWAIEADLMASNPAREVRRKKYATEGFHTWTSAELAAFEARHPIGSKARLALALLLYLGVRKGDLVRLGPSNSNGAEIKFVPNKTRHKRTAESVKPILPALAHVLAQTPTGELTFLETGQGRPFTAKGFGGWFRARCDEAGLPQCSAHGLRKLGATRCAENGATDHELMALYDWTSPNQAATYTRAASREKMAASAARRLN